jgi:DNA repair photolyase
MSDPYNPCEREYKLTRAALEIVNTYGFGIGIATKSNLVTRDIDILSSIKKHSPVIVKVTITTCDDALSKIVEPSAPVSSTRLEAIGTLSDKNIFVGILLMPVLPFIEDNEKNILTIVRLAKQKGAKFIYADFGVTLRQNQRAYYYEQLDKHFPTLKQKYIENYGNSYRCGSPDYKQLYKLFAAECEKQGLLYKMQDIIEGYQLAYQKQQISLF